MGAKDLCVSLLSNIVVSSFLMVFIGKIYEKQYHYEHFTILPELISFHFWVFSMLMEIIVILILVFKDGILPIIIFIIAMFSAVKNTSSLDASILFIKLIACFVILTAIVYVMKFIGKKSNRVKSLIDLISTYLAPLNRILTNIDSFPAPTQLKLIIMLSYFASGIVTVFPFYDFLETHKFLYAPSSVISNDTYLYQMIFFPFSILLLVVEIIKKLKASHQ